MTDAGLAPKRPDGRTGVRFFALALISGAVAINYLDRAILGVATPDIRSEFHLDAAAMGIVFSAFSWSYFAAQIPGGVLLDKFGSRIVYLIAIAGWSAATLAHAFTRGVASLIGLRMALGFFEAPCFPANSNIVAAWFPRGERAMAIGVYTAAEYIALGFASPLLFWIVAQHGWRSLFFLSGAVGLAFTLVWWAFYRDPDKGRANQAELDYIAAGGGRTKSESRPFSWALLGKLAGNKQIMGLCLGQFAVYSTFVFFLTWFPTYLATERQMGWIKVGWFASLPYLAGFFGILFAGWLSDTLLRRGVSLNKARKIPVIAGLLGAATIIAAAYVPDNTIVVAIMSVAFFSQAMSSSGWAVLSEMAPKGTMGLVGGLFSAAANLSGIVTPLVIGFIVQGTGSFEWALCFVGAVAALGAFAWIFLIGDIRPIEID
jgi:ACS family D-galactonate transporter-like MFS transporter